MNTMAMDFCDLIDLLAAVKDGIESSVPGKTWVRAEISSIRSSRGHCYLELSQSGDKGIEAKVSAIIWASQFRLLEPYFRTVTGRPLSQGMQILAQVQVNFSELYGLSLIISDIDPNFTVGAREIERQRTIQRLIDEGLMDRQKELAMPVLPYNLALVSSPDAAGYGDFIKHLSENPYGFVLKTELYPALMQGADCPASIAAAIEAIEASGNQYDAVLILRGGGANLDLACYDDYVMAAAIANCDIPVFTAVGHERDSHICDMVAYCSVKTPTALADELIDYYVSEDERISSYSSRLRTAFLSKISVMEANVAALEAKINAADPRNILKRGYLLATDASGVVLKSVTHIKKGDEVKVMFPDGALKCEVVEKQEHNG